MRQVFVFLALLNFGLCATILGSRLAKPYAPALWSSPWVDVIVVYGIGLLLTWPLTLVAGIVHALGAASSPPSSGPRPMHCRSCGYILIGLSEPRCPECGRAFDPHDPATFRRDLPTGRDLGLLLAWTWLAVSGLLVAYFVSGLLGILFP